MPLNSDWLTAPIPKPAPELRLSIVIPSHNEPDVISTLESLSRNTPIDSAVEVIWVLNAAANALPEIQARHIESQQAIETWKQTKRPEFEIIVINAHDLPPKHAGVGLARRIGMDLAAERFQSFGCPEGVIVCLDADCSVAPNYLEALEQHFFETFPKSPACSLNFAHPLSGHLPEALYKGILRYELYLRYYIQGLRYAQLPHAFHTIGSSMAVRAGVYQAQGGMNRRKAGEDFYFLHKLIPLGGFSQLNQTTVFPSPRISNRVPFGTGRAMGEWMLHPQAEYPVYHPQTFADLRQLVLALDGLYPLTPLKIEAFFAALPQSLKTWLDLRQTQEKLNEIQANSTSEKVFRQRFFRWLDGFRILKFTHFARDHVYPEKPLVTAATELALWRGVNPPESADLKKLLEIFRELDLKSYSDSGY